MIAFFQTGGIGDAIMGTAAIRCLAERYGDVGVLYFNPLVPQVLDGRDGVAWTRHMPAHKCRSMRSIKEAVPECGMVVFNKFRRDFAGRLSFFVPMGDDCRQYLDDASEYYERYLAAICDMVGRKRGSLDDFDHFWLMRAFNRETDYFADWKRYGFDVGYEDVGVPMPQGMEDRHPKVAEMGDFAIVHDSKYPVDGESAYLMKSWYGPRWGEVSRRIYEELGLPVVQIAGLRQPVFWSGAKRQSEIIGPDAVFEDYLWLLSRCKLYVGADSWPAHAAIFVREPKYVLLKGAVSMRWDHGGRFSRIIRKGDCQACEGPPMSVRECIWERGTHQCMNLIAAEDVISAAKEELCA